MVIYVSSGDKKRERKKYSEIRISDIAIVTGQNGARVWPSVGTTADNARFLHTPRTFDGRARR